MSPPASVPSLLIACLLMAPAGCAPSAEVAERPLSVLFLMTDQHRADAVGWERASVSTPNLDAFAAESVVFDRAFCTTPQCRPSRWSMWLGQYARTHGVVRNTIDEDPEAVTLAEYFRSAGYRTGSIGKHHMDREWMTAEHGFEAVFDIHSYGRKVAERETRAGRSYSQFLHIRGNEDTVVASALDMPEELHPTTVWADAAIEALATQGDRPFFLQVSFFGPHHPFTPSREWLERQEALPLELPANREYAFDGDVPALSRLQSKYPTTLEEDRRRTRHYLAWVSQIDHAVGRILTALDELGLADDTLVVFTSDHGEMGGSHGMWTKGQLGYEETLRVPMVVRDPRLDRRPAHVSELVSTIDLFPTLLALTGQDPAPSEGTSLVPLLSGEQVEWRDAVFCEIGDETRKHTSLVRGERFKYVLYREGEETAYEQLFDLELDPGETNDLARTPEHAAELRRWRSRLAEWEREHPRKPRAE